MIAVGVAALVGIATGWTTRGWQADAAQLVAERKLKDAEQKEMDRANTLSTLWAQNAEAIRAEGRRRAERLRKELEDERYRCAVPDGGRLLLDGAIDAANAARQPRAAVPGASPSGGHDAGRPAGT